MGKIFVNGTVMRQPLDALSAGPPTASQNDLALSQCFKP